MPKTKSRKIGEFVAWYCSEPRLAFNRTRFSSSLDMSRSRRQSAIWGASRGFGWPSTTPWASNRNLPRDRNGSRVGRAERPPLATSRDDPAR